MKPAQLVLERQIALQHQRGAIRPGAILMLLVFAASFALSIFILLSNDSSDPTPAAANGANTTAPGVAPSSTANPASRGTSNRTAAPAEIERQPVQLDATDQFQAAGGVVFEPARQGGQFVGFRIISNQDDPRLAIGDVVTAINGAPVEDSAAGSELFIAGLANRSAPVSKLGEDQAGERAE